MIRTPKHLRLINLQFCLVSNIDCSHILRSNSVTNQSLCSGSTFSRTAFSTSIVASSTSSLTMMASEYWRSPYELLSKKVADTEYLEPSRSVTHFWLSSARGSAAGVSKVMRSMLTVYSSIWASVTSIWYVKLVTERTDKMVRSERTRSSILDNTVRTEKVVGV